MGASGGPRRVLFREWQICFASGKAPSAMRLLSYRSSPMFSWPALLSMPLIGAALGLMGPFASYGTMDVAARVGHFAFCVTVIGALVSLTSYLVARSLFQGYWPVWAAFCVDLLLTPVAALVVYLSLAIFAADSLIHIRPEDLLWQNLFMVLAFRTGSLIASWHRIRKGDQVAVPIETAPLADDLRRRMPFSLRAEPIIALSAEDHYIRIHTPRGEALIHMTLGQAAAQLGDGFQVHRSHWVARSGIAGTTASTVRLLTGLAIPVSRHRIRDFRSWLDAA